MVQEETCECGAQTLFVEYKQEKSKLPNGVSESKGCVFCNTDFSRLVDRPKTAVNSRPPRPFRGGKTGGRGRGRGGRARQPKDKMAQLAAYFV